MVAVVTSDPFSMKFPFPPPKCCDHIMCTKDWYPVCAGDTVSPPRTFPNMCELDRYNCYSGNSKLPFLQAVDMSPTCVSWTDTTATPGTLDRYNCYSGNSKLPFLQTVDMSPTCVSWTDTTATPGTVSYLSFRTVDMSPSSPFKTSKTSPLVAVNNFLGTDSQDSDLEILYNEECKPQKKFPPECCTKYFPVCAGDGTVTAKSFGNKCLMELYNNVNGMNLKVLYEGECCREKTCKKDCPKDYKPVCAGDGINPPETFCNKCELEVQNCIKEKGMSHRGNPLPIEGERGRELPGSMTSCIISRFQGHNLFLSRHVELTNWHQGCDDVTGKTHYHIDGGRRRDLRGYHAFCAARHTAAKAVAFSKSLGTSKSFYALPSEKLAVVSYKTPATKAARNNLSTWRLMAPFMRTRRFSAVRCLDIRAANPWLTDLATHHYQKLQSRLKLDLKVLYEGECCREKTCKKDCPKDYKPVCAGDGINPPETFCNKCELEEQNCIKEKDLKVLYEGECCLEKTCKKDCPKDYKPVCAGDGINPPETFCNKCELEEQNCIREKDEVQTHLGGGKVEIHLRKTALSDPTGIKPRSPHHRQPVYCESNALDHTDTEADLKVLYEGECCREKTCKKDCPKDYKPVCAGDGINPPETFCNKYLKVLHEGKCTNPTKCSIQICPYNYQPVCAGDSADLPQTFPNLCTLENYNCANDKWLEVLYDGECREKGHCSTICCPEDYIPVCAGDSTSPLITFNNTCELEKHNCLEGTGACDSPSTCPKVCSADYNPVCAKDCNNHILTFSNLCMLESYNCCHEKKYEILYEGECKSQKECTSVNHVKYEPVCAGDGTSPAQTFSNTWALKVYNWLNNKNLIVFYDGKCCPQTECPTFCCQNYEPVCASDDVCVPETFSNLCSLSKYNCFNGKNLKVLYKGACQYKDCPTSCTREYKPKRRAATSFKVVIYSCLDLSCRATKLAPAMSHQGCDKDMTSSGKPIAT
uniref:Kazal-like domain-containing protein n=1 Tax=Timema bartmani TaxID=61472 RepID=A0A7R9F0F7_9NEOP|nr:unnamed protein product [Timema bartmani]